MCFFFSIFPATILTTLSYFVWYAAGKAEGNRQRWGIYLASWLLVVAFGSIAGGAFVTLAGLCPIARILGEGAGL